MTHDFIMQPTNSSDSEVVAVVMEESLGEHKTWGRRCYGNLRNAACRVAGPAFTGWRIYCLQPVLPAAFALAMLYLTVLSLGGTTLPTL